MILSQIRSSNSTHKFTTTCITCNGCMHVHQPCQRSNPYQDRLAKNTLYPVFAILLSLVKIFLDFVKVFSKNLAIVLDKARKILQDFSRSWKNIEENSRTWQKNCKNQFVFNFLAAMTMYATTL